LLDSPHSELGLYKRQRSPVASDLRRPTLSWFLETVSAQAKTTLDLLLRAEDIGVFSCEIFTSTFNPLLVRISTKDEPN
jgi:hypothetical protein